MKRNETIKNMVVYCFLMIATIITIFPILYTVASSFKTNLEIMAEPWRVFPAEPTMDNYIKAWTDPYFNVGHMFVNSIFYTLANVLIAVVISSMAGYVFARGGFPFKKVIFGCFVSLMFIKTGGITIYALFEILGAIHLNRSLFSLVLIKLFGVPIVNIYLVKGYVETLPKELDEAASIDGCSFYATYHKIILPLLKPIMATVAILSFQSSWNEYLLPTVFTITEPKQQTLIVGLMQLKNSSGAATSWNLILAGATIALIPVLAAYTIANRYFVSGLAAGAVKE